MSILELTIIGVIMSAFGFWGQVRFILRIPIDLVIISKKMDIQTTQTILSYLTEKYKGRSGNRAQYRSNLVYVKPLKYNYRVFFEDLLNNGQLYFNGWKPIWYSMDEGGPGRSSTFLISYFRWTFNWDKLLKDVARDEKEKETAIIHQRFDIIYHGSNHGSKQDNNSAPEGNKWKSLNSFKSTAEESPGVPRSGIRIIHWTADQLGNKEPIPLATMSLRPEMIKIVNEIRFFLGSRDWYEDRGIPWRRGWLLHGKPGTGKTSFVRGIATEFDLPVHVFDLAAMYNTSVREAWNTALEQAPCIVLLEDIDSVFEGRTNISKAKGQDFAGNLTFDCLLNCIGGITPAEGILLFVTSNLIDKIDEALTRGGRLDRTIEVLGLDEAGRIKLAERILEDRTEALRIAKDPQFKDVTPAEFQEALSRIAIKRRFG